MLCKMLQNKREVQVRLMVRRWVLTREKKEYPQESDHGAIATNATTKYVSTVLLAYGR